MRKLPVWAWFGLLVAAPEALCQRRVDPHNLYVRVWAVVPMVGTGTKADPKRPLYAPGPAALSAMAQRQGIIAFSAQLSDDKKFALVEIVGRDRAALKGILDDKRTDVKVFEKGRVREQDIVTEFRKFKRDFDPRKFGAGLQ
jgi:hypothetical protein